MKTIKLVILAIGVLVVGMAGAQEYKVDTDKSSLKWTGTKVTGEHWGYIQLKEGEMVMKDGKITKGTFVIDMASIDCQDIESEEYNQKLVGHLKSDDFFGVVSHPLSVLEITKASAFKGNKAMVEGNLTIKEITHPVTFEVMKDGSTYTSKITVDRAKYDVRYGSGSFFDNLGDKMIYDDFDLEVKLETRD